MARRFPRAKWLTLGQQVAGMAAAWPQLKAQWGATQVVWTGPIQAAEMCGQYMIQIAYRLNDTPNVHVPSPRLRGREDGSPIPHVYPGNRLCLYLPGSGEWHPTKFLSQTIVPWTSLWLYFYEVWHATGIWKGDGVMPGDKRMPAERFK